jgi:hypothetical protein
MNDLQAAEFMQVGAPTLEAIQRLENVLRQGPTIDADSRTVHTFGPGFYARTLHLKAGETLTGKVHSTEHIFILSQGELLVATEDGKARLKAPYQSVSRPGLKRAGYAVTDVVVTNVHITAETDLAKLELELIAPDPVQSLEN